MNFDKEFEEKGKENLNIMEKSGFLKKQGYGKNLGWKIIASILGFLGIVSLFFLCYQVYDGKFQFNANPNVLCESQTCNVACPKCPSNNITCKPAIINITINNPIISQ